MLGFGSARTRIGVVLPLLVALAPLVAVGVIATPAGAAGNTWYVSALGSGSACTVVAPCATLTQALSLAGSGDTIEVAGTITANVLLDTSVTISQWPGQPAAVLNGGGISPVIIVDSGLNVTLSGLTIENGEAGVGLTFNGAGGGITDTGSTVTVANSVIENNNASEPGTTTFFQAGGIGVVDSGSLTLDDSSVQGNTNLDGQGFPGPGGLINFGGTVVVNDSTISNNSAVGGGGGGIGQPGGSLTLNNSTVADNAAGTQGGGVFNGGALTVTDSTISNNSAPVGGGISQPGGSLTLNNSTVADNAAGAQGGGVFNGGAITVTDSTISANSAPAGQGAGILDSGGGATTLAGTILATPGGAPAGAECAGGSFTDGGYNVDDDGTCGLSVTNHSVSDSATIGSFVGPLADNGGPTQTIALSSGTTNPAQAAIPVTFTAPGQTTPACSQADQRGVARGAPCDMGSFALTVTFAPVVQSFVGGSYLAATPDGLGYWIAGPTGAVVAYGSAGNYGSMAGKPLNAPVVGITATPDGKGYWLVGADGGVFNFGDAGFFNSMGGMRLNKPIVGVVGTPSGEGYWLVGADGGVFSFGDATFFGSMGGKPLNKPIVGMASHPNTQGYWLVASDGGVFSFGAAGFRGSAANITLNQPVIGLTSSPDGAGYWLVAADGGVFAYPDASFYGSGVGSGKTAIGLIATSASSGYAIVDTDGTRSAFPS